MDIQVREREATSGRGAEPKPSKGGGGMSPEKMKIVVAVTLFVLAAVVVAWQLGAFSFGGGQAEVTPMGGSVEEEEKIWEEAQRERQVTHPPAITPPPSGS